MGKIFLCLILVALLYGGYAIYRNISEVTSPEGLRNRYKPEELASESSRGPEDGQNKDVAPSKRDLVSANIEAQKEPLPVVASSGEFIQVEGWDIVRAGGLLPDGSILRAWNHLEAMVTAPNGRTEVRRFRRWQEAMHDLVPVASSESVVGSFLAPKN